MLICDTPALSRSLVATLRAVSRQMSRVGQNNIYTVCIRYFWQGNHHIYGHIRYIYTVLANPTNERERAGASQMDTSNALALRCTSLILNISISA